MKEPELIYQQRYETFRYLDRLQWQIMQIGIVSSSVILTIRNSSEQSEAKMITLAAAGLVLFSSGLAMKKIRFGIRENSLVLAEAGKEIGDAQIPSQRSNWKSVSAWISCVMAVIGIIFVIKAGCIYFGWAK